MPRTALFAGLVVDEFDRAVGVANVGDEPCYVVDDAGFRRHIPADQVDRAVLQSMGEMIEGNEDLLAKEGAKLLGQDDPFSMAMLQSQFKNIQDQFDRILETGLPEEGRAYMGMMGFKIRINLHGEVLEIIQPSAIDPDSE
jgi:hypothetical protein